MKRTKLPEDLTVSELRSLVQDMHALMWASDAACEICAHATVEQREPYKKLGCSLGGPINCEPLWRGFVEEIEDPF